MSVAIEPTRAYVALVDNSKNRCIVINGREVAVHQRALEETVESPSKLRALASDLAKARYRDWTKNKTVNGILLIGRSAFAGGRMERGESAKDAAIREVAEEMRVQLTHDDLMPLSSFEDKVFFIAYLDPKLAEQPFLETVEKRSAEYVSPAKLIELVERPDDADRAYIGEEMKKLANLLAARIAELPYQIALSEEKVAEFAADMLEWQLNREQPAHVAAARALLELQVGEIQWHTSFMSRPLGGNPTGPGVAKVWKGSQSTGLTMQKNIELSLYIP